MDKPFKTVDEQIAILESRGMQTDADTVHMLRQEGYYSIVNGYKDLFLDRPAMIGGNGDVYKPGATFQEMFKLYSFDRDLRLTMFRYFSIAEATLKTACAYQFSAAHASEIEPYLKIANYRQERRYAGRIDGLISDFNTALGRNPHKRPKRKAYLEHYRQHHDEVPLWVLLRYMTLGQAFKFYEFQNESMRNAIAKHFSMLYADTHDVPVRISERQLRLAYDHIKDFRNICAHDERLYCARVSPSKDVSISGVISDLGLILPKDENLRMVKSVGTLLLDIANDLKTVGLRDVLDAMGMESIEKTLSIRE
ncbi:Abi family protein [uncultured Slackia sp.]|uniref:Abi family protein n=1 Tax=uncultured Slackia sp. TaxID=665903 RepID=UPI0025F35F7E|nr:Abi family protein [uncultured Slackia sp.]